MAKARKKLKIGDVVKEDRQCAACDGSGSIHKEFPVVECIQCGEPFVRRRKDAMTCSKSCSNIVQVKRSRERQKQERDAS